MKKLLIAIIAIGTFMALGYWEHHYTRNDCMVVSAAGGFITIEDLQGNLWQCSADIPINSIVDLQMQDNFTPSDITDDIIKKVILRKVGIEEEKTEEVQAVVIEEEEPQKKLKSLGYFVCTAYCKCRKCCGKSDGITASGVIATANHTIAAPKGFAFGEKLIINGIEYVVEDRGGAIKGNRIDIYFDTHAEALQFGRQTIEVFAYE